MMLAAAAVDLVVYIARTRDGRVVQSVREITGVDGATVLTNEVFRPGHDGRAHPHAAISTALLEDLVAVGYDPSPHHGPAGWAA